MHEGLKVAILIVDGWRFHSTYDSEKSAYETYKNLIHTTRLTTKKTVKPFGVSIAKLNPMTGEVVEWHKVEGWSLWAQDIE